MPTAYPTELKVKTIRRYKKGKSIKVLSEELYISHAVKGRYLSHWEMVKNGAKSASNVEAGAFGELGSQDHGLP